jgi:hypothetical protein
MAEFQCSEFEGGGWQKTDEFETPERDYRSAVTALAASIESMPDPPEARGGNRYFCARAKFSAHSASGSARPTESAGAGCNRGVPQLRNATRSLAFSGVRVAMEQGSEVGYHGVDIGESDQIVVGTTGRNPCINAPKGTSWVPDRYRTRTGCDECEQFCASRRDRVAIRSAPRAVARSGLRNGPGGSPQHRARASGGLRRFRASDRPPVRRPGPFAMALSTIPATRARRGRGGAGSCRASLTLRSLTD